MVAPLTGTFGVGLSQITLTVGYSLSRVDCKNVDCTFEDEKGNVFSPLPRSLSVSGKTKNPFQGVVYHKRRFQDICIGWAGRVHDARVLANSSLFAKGQNGTLFPRDVEVINGVEVPLYLVGDPAYPLLPWLLKVYASNRRLSRAEKFFNRSLCKMRFVVEHAFGRLKGRWRCLLKRNDTTVEYIIQQTAACCILHNLCEMQEEEFKENLEVEQESENEQFNFNNVQADEVEDVRDAFRDMLQQQNNI